MSAATTSGRATDQAIAKIKDLISSGEFTAGSRLPTERELTQRFGVSRSSLREAIRALRSDRRTRVTRRRRHLRDDARTGAPAHRHGFVSDLVAGGSLLEMHQVRRILEPEATRLATPRLTEHDLARLEECLRQMNVEKSAQPFIEADTAFHAVILDACGNPTLASMIQNLSSGTLRARMWQAVVAQGAVEATRASHWAIYNALLARDADMAAAADLMHLAIAEEWLRQLLDGAESPT